MPLVRKDRGPSPAGAVDPAADQLALLIDGTDEQRWAAARAAGDMPASIDALGKALFGETDPRVRAAIFTSLARLHTAESVQAVLPHLRSDDSNVRTGALDALRAMPQAAGRCLPALLRDGDPDVRLLICEIARGLPAAEANPLLCDLIETEPEVNVCAAAVDVLAEIGGPEALPVLARCALRFAGNPFLGFSIKIAAERIGSQPAAPGG